MNIRSGSGNWPVGFGISTRFRYMRRVSAGFVIRAESLVVRQIFWLSVCLCSGRLLAKLNLGKSDTLPSTVYFTVGLQIRFSDYIVIDL